MKPSALFINNGRGPTVDEKALIKALEEGWIAGAGLDVFEVEPLPRTSPLWNHPAVFVTPHAAATSDPVHLVEPMLEQMAAFERGEPLQNVVDRGAGY